VLKLDNRECNDILSLGSVTLASEKLMSFIMLKMEEGVIVYQR
jgi:hypothetical protein